VELVSLVFTQGWLPWSGTGAAKQPFIAANQLCISVCYADLHMQQAATHLDEQCTLAYLELLFLFFLSRNIFLLQAQFDHAQQKPTRLAEVASSQTELIAGLARVLVDFPRLCA
jgi:hypothetical protein